MQLSWNYINKQFKIEHIIPRILFSKFCRYDMIFQGYSEQLLLIVDRFCVHGHTKETTKIMPMH